MEISEAVYIGQGECLDAMDRYGIMLLEEVLSKIVDGGNPENIKTFIQDTIKKMP